MQRFISLIHLQTTGLPSAQCPKQITIWNQNRRPIAANRQPTIDNLEAFICAFWRWWDELNPPWRIRVNGRLEIGGTGPWDTLHKSGQNGFLSVLQILCWWRTMLGVGRVEASEDWNSAVKDVTWVLNEVLNSKTSAEIANSTRVHKRPSKRRHDELDSSVADKSDDGAQAASESCRSKRCVSCILLTYSCIFLTIS